MAETKRDNNQVFTMMGVLATDGTTPKRIYVTPSDHLLCAADGASGSDVGDDNAARDNSGVPVLLAASSNDDGSVVPLFVDASGNLLIKST